MSDAEVFAVMHHGKRVKENSW